MSYCFACAKPLSEADLNVKTINVYIEIIDFMLDFDFEKVYECETCHNIVCLDCDLFIRETLHTCPGCASDSNKAQMKTK